MSIVNCDSCADQLDTDDCNHYESKDGGFLCDTCAESQEKRDTIIAYLENQIKILKGVK